MPTGKDRPLIDLAPQPRNERLVDWWSATHVVWGIGLVSLVDAWIALLILVAWEPIEVLVLSPLLAKVGIGFGREGLVNSLSDIAFDALGVAAGLALARFLGWDVPVWRLL